MVGDLRPGGRSFDQVQPSHPAHAVTGRVLRRPMSGDAVRAAVRDMIGVAVAAGHPVMMPVFSPDRDECRALMDDYAAIGVRTFVLGSDKILVASAFGDWLHGLRA